VGRKDETVGLITDRSRQELPAQAWLQATNRQDWGIENGTHLRLDVSLEDRCRVRNTNGLWILGMLRRLAISLYIHWQHQQPNPRSLWFTDFQAALGEDNLARSSPWLQTVTQN
jgi:hypothetical protein